MTKRWLRDVRLLKHCVAVFYGNAIREDLPDPPRQTPRILLRKSRREWKTKRTRGKVEGSGYAPCVGSANEELSGCFSLSREDRSRLISRTTRSRSARIRGYGDFDLWLLNNLARRSLREGESIWTINRGTNSRRVLKSHSSRFVGIGLSRWGAARATKGTGSIALKFPLDSGTDRCCYHDGEFHRGVAIIGTNSQAIKTSLNYEEVI